MLLISNSKLPRPSVRVIWEYTTCPTGTISGSIKLKSDGETDSNLDPPNLITVKEEEEEMVPVPEENDQ